MAIFNTHNLKYFGNAKFALLAACLTVAGCSTQSSRSGLLFDVNRHDVQSAIAKQIGANPAEMQQAFDSSPAVEHFNATGTTARMAQRFGVSTDLAMTQYLQNMLDRLTKVINAEGRNFVVVLLSNAQINAYTPGAGKILINEGLLAYCQTEGEVAAVLAHEVAHVVMGHPQRVRQLALISKASQRFVDTITPINFRDSMAPLLKRRSIATFNYMRRNQEMLADSVGIDIMVAAGYDPREMVSVLRELGRAIPQATKSRRLIYGDHPLSVVRESATFDKIRTNYPNVRGVVTTAKFAKLVKPYHNWRDKREVSAQFATPTAE